MGSPLNLKPDISGSHHDQKTCHHLYRQPEPVCQRQPRMDGSRPPGGEYLSIWRVLQLRPMAACWQHLLGILRDHGHGQPLVTGTQLRAPSPLKLRDCDAILNTRNSYEK
jgi:hypothetical protein